MLKIIEDSDILRDKAEALVNPVNCVGVMGAGLAKAFLLKFNDDTNYFNAHYISLCQSKALRPGKCFIHFRHTEINKYIIFFPTKDHFKDPSKLEFIEEGLLSLEGIVKELKISSIAMPKLGCGLGGLDYNDVKPLIEAFVDRVPYTEVRLYE
jgi:O-acetyl-ADP-ribose deacetylase (regulator of RNase III)